MGGQISLFKNPNELLQKYLPDFTYSKTLLSQPFFHSFMCSTQDEGQVVCKFFLEDLGIDDPEVMDSMRLIQEGFDLTKHPNVLVQTMERFEIKMGNQT